MIELALSSEPATKQTSAKKSQQVRPGKHKGDQFPLPRYFQTHFQYIHENTHSTQCELKQFQQHLTTIENKLEQLLKIYEGN